MGFVGVWLFFGGFGCLFVFLNEYQEHMFMFFFHHLTKTTENV